MNYITKSVRVFAQVLGVIVNSDRPTDEIVTQYPYFRYYG